MKFTRRALGEVAAAAVFSPVAVTVLAPAAALAQNTAPDASQRNWLAEARDARTAAAQAMARVALPMDVEPAFRFLA